MTDFGISKASLPLQKQSSSEQFKSQGRRPSSGLVLPVKPKAFKGVWSPENVNTKQTEAPPKTIDVEMETNQGEGVAIQDEKTKTTPLRLSIANVQPCVEEVCCDKICMMIRCGLAMSIYFFNYYYNIEKEI